MPSDTSLEARADANAKRFEYIQDPGGSTAGFDAGMLR
jgi:hypothetical protein